MWLKHILYFLDWSRNQTILDEKASDIEVFVANAQAGKDDEKILNLIEDFFDKYILTELEVNRKDQNV